MLISIQEQALLLLVREIGFGEVYDTLIPEDNYTIEVQTSTSERLFLECLRENPEIEKLTIHNSLPQYLEVRGMRGTIKYRQKHKFI